MKTKINTSRLAARVRAVAQLVLAVALAALAVRGTGVEFVVLASLAVTLVFLSVVNLTVGTRFERGWS